MASSPPCKVNRGSLDVGEGIKRPVGYTFRCKAEIIIMDGRILRKKIKTTARTFHLENKDFEDEIDEIVWEFIRELQSKRKFQRY